MTDIPDWAIERANDLAENVKHDDPTERYHVALAELIAKHEKPPVDQVTLIARELAGDAWRYGSNNWIWGSPDQYVTDEYDQDPEIQLLIRAINRGIEIGKASK